MNIANSNIGRFVFSYLCLRYDYGKLPEIDDKDIPGKVFRNLK
jgi:hypothetical protein